LRRIKFFLIPVLAIVLASCATNSSKSISVNLAPVPYAIEVESDIAKRLSVEDLGSDLSNVFSMQAKQAGAISQVRINYKADDGSIHGFAVVYFFAKADFDKTLNPNEPPLYGSKVLEKSGMVLAIAGPQDSIFEPTTQDGKNISALYVLVYDPKSFKSS